MNVRSVILAAGLACAASAHAADYTIDTVHTQIYACVSHLGFSTPCARFKVKHGRFCFDESDWNRASVEATIDVASADLGDAAWNARVHSWQFLEAGKHPLARFVSRAAHRTSERAGVVSGTLTLRGVSREVDLHVDFNREGIDPYTLRHTAGFTASTTLKRSAFGMDKYLPDIGDNVTIRIEAEGLRGDPPPQSAHDPELEH